MNQLFKNIQRSQLGNFFTIPTDCPQRNERMGWTGDAQAYTRTGIYNANTQNFYRQWMVALRADQGIGSDTEVPGGIGSTVPTYNRTDDPTFATGTTLRLLSARFLGKCTSSTVTPRSSRRTWKP